MNSSLKNNWIRVKTQKHFLFMDPAALRRRGWEIWHDRMPAPKDTTKHHRQPLYFFVFADLINCGRANNSLVMSLGGWFAGLWKMRHLRFLRPSKRRDKLVSAATRKLGVRTWLRHDKPSQTIRVGISEKSWRNMITIWESYDAQIFWSKNI